MTVDNHHDTYASAMVVCAVLNYPAVGNLHHDQIWSYIVPMMDHLICTGNSFEGGYIMSKQSNKFT